MSSVRALVTWGLHINPIAKRRRRVNLSFSLLKAFLTSGERTKKLELEAVTIALGTFVTVERKS